MKKTLTPDQIAKRDERKAKFRALWKQVSAMPELERIEMSIRNGFRKLDAGEFSPCNSMLIALQLPGASVLGGFRQWLAQGRAVRKGEHGAMIWVPTGRKSAELAPGEVVTENDGDKAGFITGTVFDIGQTEAIEPEVSDCMGSEANVETHYNQPREDRELVAA